MGRILACVLVCTLCSAGRAAEPAGYVLARQGAWKVLGERVALAVGAPVAAGARLVVERPVAGDHIALVEPRSGALLLSLRCDAARACDVPVVVPAGTGGREQPSALAQAFSRIVARFAGEPDRYVATLSRGSAQLPDSIVAWTETGSDLAAAFAALPDGTYRVRLSTLRCRPAGGCPERPVQAHVEWARSAGAAIVSDLRPGLYELVVDRPATGTGPARARSWVLLLSSSDLGEAEKHHRAALGVVDSWGSAIDSPTKQGVARALLDALAES